MASVNARDVFFIKSICCIIQKGMSLEEAMVALCKYYEALKKSTSLDQVNYAHLGIKNNCKLKYENLLTEVLNALIANDIKFENQIQIIQSTLSGLNTSIGNLKDEKVKASASDTTPGFLKDKVVTNQPGSIVYNDATILITGFVPIGAVFYVNKSRLGDFDGTGKGKANTDVYGYAISNGSNGTTNRLNRMPRYIDDIANAGNTGGADKYKLQTSDLPSMSLNVTGTISDALITPVELEMEFNKNRLSDGAGGSVYLLRLTPPGTLGSDRMRTIPYNLRHSHSHSLVANSTNPNNSEIPLLPTHILEIPIERIPV